VSHKYKSKGVLYFIDESVPHREAIFRELPASAEVRIIGFSDDGVAQVLAALAGKRDISAIHLVSHGRPGVIMLGAGVIDTTTLTNRAEDFVAIGRALASDADLLLYGCNVAKGESGKAFLATLSDLTGANVAASETPTGAAHLGGDWDLEVRLGSVQTPLLNIPSYAGVLAAPVISGLSPIAYTEDGAPQTLGSGVTFSGGIGYPGGSITFEVSGATSGDQLKLFSDPNPNALDAISFDNSGNAYVGTGTGRVLIGTVDPTENGQNGQPLTVHFIGNPTGVFSDSSFESDDLTTGWQSEWTVVENRVILGTDTIAGWPSPADTTRPAGNNGTVSPGDGGPMTDALDFNVDVVTGAGNASNGDRGLRLYSQDNPAGGQQNSEPYGIIHGPYVYSDAFPAVAGDILRFDWKAAGGTDAFDAFGYLLNADTGQTVICLDQTGTSQNATTPWATASVIVPSNGNWQFVFVSGSFDYTGGRATGGSLYIDNFSVQRSPVNDTVLGALAQHVQYETTSDTPPDASRTVTVEVSDGINDRKTADTTLDITPVNDAAVLSSDTKELTETNAVLSTSGTLTITDPDSPATFQAQSNVTGQYGTFSIGTNGAWTYVASSAYNELKVGQAYTDTFTVTSADGTTTTVTVKINGTNDVPVATATTNSVAEDATISGSVTGTDADQGEAALLSYALVGVAPAGLTFNPDGTYTFDASSYDTLPAGASQTLTIPFTVTDANNATSAPANLVITLTGTNDAPVVSGAVTGAASEGGTDVTLDALKNASDVDAGSVLTVVDVGTIPAGVTYDPATHSFTLDPTHPAYQSLAAGATQTVTVEYNVSDGTTKTPTSVSWTVTGTNDAAVLSSDTKDLTETDAVLSTGGTLTIADVDSPATFVAQTATAGQYGTFAIGTNGTWTYVASSAHAALKDGEKVSEVFEVFSADGTRTTVTVNITGTNDAAQLSAAVVTLTEGDTAAALSTSGQLTISDVDSPATFVAQSNVAGQYGTFAVGTDGKWTYVASSAHDEFEPGQTYTDSFTVTSADGTTTTVTVNLTGTNDAASGGVDVAGVPTQGYVLTATNDVVDPEGIDPTSVAYQWQRRQPDGSWVNIIGATGANYALTQDDVDAGHVRAVMSYTDLGGTSATVAGNAIPVANANDAPTGAVTITGEAREGQPLTAINTLADEDGLGTLTYQWMADGVVIQGATGATLTLTSDQVGKAITVVVSYIDGYGTPESVISPASSVVVNGNAGDDQFYGGSGNDKLYGGTGEDRLYGYGGRDRLFGEAGNDTIDGGADNDTIYGGSGDDQLFGNSGKDRLYGNEGRDKLSGGASNDTISGGADNDTVDGGVGNDRLYGDAGNDALKGGSGNDWIVGGLGRDKLYGGSGADVFDFNSTQESRVGSQRDTIHDFQSGRDLIDLRGIDANEFRKGNQAFTWSCMDMAFVNPNEADSSLLKTGFTGKAGQLRYDRGILMGDTDGDRKADFQIKIVGHFTVGDLLL
jgi:VCBS repeat-containing protein